MHTSGKRLLASRHSKDDSALQWGCTCGDPLGHIVCLVGAVEDASSKPTMEVHEQESGSTELQSARVGIAAALKRRGELDAELAHLHAELAAARAELADVQASQSPPGVLKLRQEIRRLRAALPVKSGEPRQGPFPLRQREPLASYMLT